MSIYCSCTSQGTSCQKYTQTLNSQIGLSQWSIELDRIHFCSCTSQYTICQKYTQTLNSQNGLSRKLTTLDQSNWIDRALLCFFCSCPGRALAVKNIRKPWTHKSVSLKSQKSIELVFMFCSCTSQGTSCQKYTQTLNSQIALSQIDRTCLIELDHVYFMLLHQPRN